MAKSDAERQKTWRERRRIWARSLLKPCAICQEFDEAMMDWHHIDPTLKTSGIAQMVSSSQSRDDILKEITKCICLCANCHRKLHYYGELGDFTVPD